MAAGEEEIQCQLVQRQAVMRQIGLTPDHYLRRQDLLPASLLAAASLCAMPEPSIYELLQERQLPAHSGTDHKAKHLILHGGVWPPAVKSIAGVALFALLVHCCVNPVDISSFVKDLSVCPYRLGRFLMKSPLLSRVWTDCSHQAYSLRKLCWVYQGERGDLEREFFNLVIR